MKRLFFYLTIALLGIAGLVSCQPGESIVGKELQMDQAGSPITVSFTSKNDWTARTDDSWIKITPTSGSAGANTITVSSAYPNPLYDVRTGKFYIIDGTTPATFTVTQATKDAINFDKEKYYGPAEGEVTINVGANIEYQITTDSDWITVPSTKAYNKSDIVLKLAKNPTDQIREGHITVKGGSITKTATIIQSGYADIKWDQTFNKRVLAFRFTGTWCGWCPALGKDLEAYTNEDPDGFTYISYYNNSGNLSTTYQSSLEKTYNVSGFPTAYLDNRAELNNYNSNKTEIYNYTACKEFTAEAKKSYPASSALMAFCDCNDGKITINGTLFTKKATEGHINAVIVESGIVANQADYIKYYEDASKAVHNNVFRAPLTNFPNGVAFSTGDQGFTPVNIEGELPATILDKENVSIMIYVTRPAESGAAGVANITYHNYGEMIDNCFILPLNGNITIEYQK